MNEASPGAGMRTIVVTGVSTGIGASIAETLVRSGFHVFGSVRKSTDAGRLATELGERFTPLIFDVTDQSSVAAAAEIVKQRLGNRTLSGLVNNAGMGIGGPLLEQPMSEFRQHLEVNLIGPLAVTRAFASMLGAERGRIGAPGRIVNISSVGGRIAAPFLGGYVASKHALEGMSASLRRELMLYGIDVIVVGPGSVVTSIWDKAEAQDVSAYAGSDYFKALGAFQSEFIRRGRQGYPPARVAKVVLEALTARKPRTRYAVVRNRFVNWTLPLILPSRIVDRLIARQLGLGRERQ